MEDDDFISKTRRKKAMTALQGLGADLVRLSPEQLARIDMPESLREAVRDCQAYTKHEARRRQLQYIGRIMRDLDAEPIAEQLAALQAPSKKQTALFHVAERWRDELLSLPDAAERFAREFPATDGARLRALVSAAGEERAAGRTPKRARELFHFVNGIVQQQGREA
jgi:ribosome-associated protein